MAFRQEQMWTCDRCAAFFRTTDAPRYDGALPEGWVHIHVGPAAKQDFDFCRVCAEWLESWIDQPMLPEPPIGSVK